MPYFDHFPCPGEIDPYMKMKMRSLDVNELIIGDSDEMRNELVIFVFGLKSLFCRFIDKLLMKIT